MSKTGLAGFNPIALIRAGIWRIALTTTVAVAVACVYAILAPKWYVAQLTVLPIPPQKGAVPMLSAGSGGVADALGDLPIEVGGAKSDAERIAAVLHSVSVTDAVIAKFDLMKRYQADYIEEARKELWEHCGTRVDKKPALVALSCEDTDPKMAHAITAYFGEYGNQVFRRVSATSAAEERKFLDKRVAEARRDMDEAARRVRDFQEKNGVVDLTEQSRAIVTVMATVRAELLSKQMQLAYVDGFSARDESTSEQLRKQVAVLEGKLRALEESRLPQSAASEPAGAAASKPGRKTRDHGAGVFPAAASVPKLKYEIEQLFREQKLQEMLFLMLAQRFEGARVNEARDTSTFGILDAPTVPTMRERPQRTLIAVEGLILGLVLGLAWALGPGWWRVFAAHVGWLQQATASGGARKQDALGG